MEFACEQYLLEALWTYMRYSAGYVFCFSVAFCVSTFYVVRLQP